MRQYLFQVRVLVENDCDVDQWRIIATLEDSIQQFVESAKGQGDVILVSIQDKL